MSGRRVSKAKKLKAPSPLQKKILTCLAKAPKSCIVLPKDKGTGTLILRFEKGGKNIHKNSPILRTIVVRMEKAGWIAKDWAGIYKLTKSGLAVA